MAITSTKLALSNLAAFQIEGRLRGIAHRSARRHVHQRIAAAQESSRGAVARRQDQVESSAADVFSQHLTQSESKHHQEVAIGLLKEALNTRKVRPDLALGAALSVEQEADEETDVAAALDGRWQLGFSSISSSKLLWYIPVPEFKDICLKDKTVKLISHLGPVTTSFEGIATMLNTQDMSFKFDKLVITLFGRSVLNRDIKFDSKIYTYYHADDALACARSKGKGIVVLKRIPADMQET